ncbi:MAG TPA: dihydrolipoamide acetyltransferase family protein [Bacillota bacterium]
MRFLQLPRFGQIMERGTILAWHVAEGQAFRTGDVIYEVETEKTTVTVEATFDGVLARRLVPEGEEVPVGAVLALCWEPGERQDPAALERALAEAKGARGGDGAAVAATLGAVAQGTAAQGEAAAQGPPTPEGAAARHPAATRPRITPRARRLAEEHGIDYTGLQGSGPGGIIQEEDIRAILAGRTGTALSQPPGRDRVAPATPAPLAGEGAAGRFIRQTPVQQAMAAAMERSWREIPQFVQTRTFEATKLLALREDLQAGGLDVSLTDLIAHVTARVVPEHPLVNATFRGGGEVLVHADVDLAVAMATDRGLVAPVLRRAQTLTLKETMTALRDLAAKARAGTLLLDEARGGTITLSNLGMLGVEWGTPIINPPQSCLVFVGAAREQVALREGRAVAVPVVSLSIAFDHRVLDGATAARFTGALCEALADPRDVVRLE